MDVEWSHKITLCGNEQFPATATATGWRAFPVNMGHLSNIVLFPGWGKNDP